MAIPLRTKLADGNWTCRWVGDLHYQKDRRGDGITVNSKVSYTNDKGDRVLTYASIYSLFMTIAGSQFEVKKGIIRSLVSNARQKRPVYIVSVAGDALTDSSKCIYRHLHFPDSQKYKQAIDAKGDSSLGGIIHRLGMPDTFGHGYGHHLPNTNPSYPIDYFIVPSYEVLRYFFLQGSRLSEHLLSYFTSVEERARHSIDELLVHPKDYPLIVQQGKLRIAYLLIKEGLSPAEIHCLARIGFIEAAYDCLEMVKGSLLGTGLKRVDYEYRGVKTQFPQDKPFQMAVCGHPFDWQGKRYMLVDQIYDTLEEMPFDRIAYSPIVDHRGQVKLSGEGKRFRINRQSHQTTPASNYQVTDNLPGDANQPTDLIAFLETGYSFGEQPEPIKLNKTGQTDRYQTIGIVPMEQSLISLLDQAQAWSGSGRGNVHRQDVTHSSSDGDRAMILFQALRLIEGYRCRYFNLDQDTPSFVPEFCLNERQSGRLYDVMLCQLEPLDNASKTSIYLIWANTVRYALFYRPALRQISESILTELCTKKFGQQGVYSFVKEDSIKEYRLHNQLSKDANGLADKIKNELNDILDDHAASFLRAS